MSEAALAEVRMDDQVLQKHGKAALRRADREQQIDHPEDHAVVPQNEDPAAVRLLQEEAEPAHLLVPIRLMIRFLAEEIEQKVGELRKILQRCLFDSGLVVRWHGRGLSQNSAKELSANLLCGEDSRKGREDVHPTPEPDHRIWPPRCRNCPHSANSMRAVSRASAKGSKPDHAESVALRLDAVLHKMARVGWFLRFTTVRDRQLLIALWCAFLVTIPLHSAELLGIDDPSQGYYTRTPRDRFTRFLADLDAGRRRIDQSGELPRLTSLLRELDIPVSSQILVYSVTSLQKELISPRRPRALYFNDDTYVGHVPGGRIEVISLDPELGGIFYISDAMRPGKGASFQRSEDCMTCHAPRHMEHIPGLVIESVVPGMTGGGERAFRRQQSGHGIPLEHRFGGYHVTGATSLYSRHWGNLLLERTAGAVRERPIALGELFDLAHYPAQTSDALAQLLHEHQVGFVNRALRTGYRTRALMQASGGDDGKCAAELETMAHELVRYILFADEVPLPPGGLDSDPAFRSAFLSNAKRVNGIGLKDLDGQTRLLRHRCSYMIDSPAFTGLPAPLKARVIAQLTTALQGDGDEYAYLPRTEKDAISLIIKNTLPDDF